MLLVSLQSHSVLLVGDDFLLIQCSMVMSSNIVKIMFLKDIMIQRDFDDRILKKQIKNYLDINFYGPT